MKKKVKVHVHNHNMRRGFDRLLLQKEWKSVHMFLNVYRIPHFVADKVWLSVSLWVVLNVSQHYFIWSLKRFCKKTKKLHLLLKYYGKSDFLFLFWNVV
jgi:hypothetical protein